MKTLNDDIDGMLVNSTERDRHTLVSQMVAVAVGLLALIGLVIWRCA